MKTAHIQRQQMSYQTIPRKILEKAEKFHASVSNPSEIP